MVAGLRMNTTTAWAAFDKMEEKVGTGWLRVVAPTHVWL